MKHSSRKLRGIIIIFMIYLFIFICIFVVLNMLTSRTIMEMTNSSLENLEISEEEKNNINYDELCEDIFRFQTNYSFINAKEEKDNNNKIEIINNCANSLDLNNSTQKSLKAYYERELETYDFKSKEKSNEESQTNITSLSQERKLESFIPTVYVGDGYVFIDDDAMDVFSYMVYIKPNYKLVGNIVVSAWNHDNPYVSMHAKIAFFSNCLVVCYILTAFVYIKKTKNK